MATSDVKALIGEMRAAPRLGADADEPEGARYVQCSSTLWAELIDALEAAVEDGARWKMVFDAAVEFLPTFYYPVGSVNEFGQEEPRSVAYRALMAAIDAARGKP